MWKCFQGRNCGENSLHLPICFPSSLLCFLFNVHNLSKGQNCSEVNGAALRVQTSPAESPGHCLCLRLGSPGGYLQFGGLEAIITALMDEYPRVLGEHRQLFVLGLSAVCFLGSLATLTNVSYGDSGRSLTP